MFVHCCMVKNFKQSIPVYVSLNIRNEHYLITFDFLAGHSGSKHPAALYHHRQSPSARSFEPSHSALLLTYHQNYAFWRSTMYSMVMRSLLLFKTKAFGKDGRRMKIREVAEYARISISLNAAIATFGEFSEKLFIGKTKNKYSPPHSFTSIAFHRITAFPVRINLPYS
ncbi:MAG: hypothetical protein HGA87_07205 [Desulfobulbaceae bacterium]|nr:hypothetical protein [Desulfobulbaceae bacterium]